MAVPPYMSRNMNTTTSHNETKHIERRGRIGES